MTIFAGVLFCSLDAALIGLLVLVAGVTRESIYIRDWKMAAIGAMLLAALSAIIVLVAALAMARA